MQEKEDITNEQTIVLTMRNGTVLHFKGEPENVKPIKKGERPKEYFCHKSCLHFTKINVVDLEMKTNQGKIIKADHIYCDTKSLNEDNDVLVCGNFDEADIFYLFTLHDKEDLKNTLKKQII